MTKDSGDNALLQFLSKVVSKLSRWQLAILVLAALGLVGAWAFLNQGEVEAARQVKQTVTGTGNQVAGGDIHYAAPEPAEVAIEKAAGIRAEAERDEKRRLARCQELFEQAIEALYPGAAPSRPARMPVDAKESSVKVHGAPILTIDQAAIERARELVRQASEECPGDWRAAYVEATAIRAEADRMRVVGPGEQQDRDFKLRVLAVYMRAMDTVQVAMDSGAEHPLLHRKLGELYLQSAELSPPSTQEWAQRAIDHLSKAALEDSPEAEALNNMAKALAIRRRPAEALKYADMALRKDPSLLEARLGRAIALAEVGNTAAAKKQLDELAPELGRLQMGVIATAVLANINVQEKRFPEALACVEECHQDGFLHRDTFLFRAQAKVGIGDYQGALEAIEVALSDKDGDPNDPLFQSAKDDIVEHLGK